MHEQGRQEEDAELGNHTDYIGDYLNGYSSGSIGGDNPPTPEIPETPKGPNGKLLVNKDTVSQTNHEKIVGEDTLGNQVVVPEGFKIAEESGTSVKEGIVIEDSKGNQFVWVPVSNINGDGTGKIKVNSINEEGVEITLGRYTFKREKNAKTGLYEDGTPTKVQCGSEYAITTVDTVATGTLTQYKIGEYWYELADSRISNELRDPTGTNTTAKNLKAFIESVRDYHGYYLARYEASYGSGYDSASSTPYANAKPLSQKSTANSTSSMNYTKGTLWNNITQPNATIVCRNMYAGNDNIEVESDLCNSYAWDTAIVYIQAMGHSNYANANKDTIGNTDLKNTGETGDEKCHIFDMASNCSELTTEYSMYKNEFKALPCTGRGGSFNSSYTYTSDHTISSAIHSQNVLTFRLLLYVK